MKKKRKLLIAASTDLIVLAVSALTSFEFKPFVRLTENEKIDLMNDLSGLNSSHFDRLQLDRWKQEEFRELLHSLVDFIRVPSSESGLQLSRELADVCGLAFFTANTDVPTFHTKVFTHMQGFKACIEEKHKVKNRAGFAWILNNWGSFFSPLSQPRLVMAELLESWCGKETVVGSSMIDDFAIFCLKIARKLDYTHVPRDVAKHFLKREILRRKRLLMPTIPAASVDMISMDFSGYEYSSPDQSEGINYMQALTRQKLAEIAKQESHRS